jgi:hypothetical protein
MSLLVTLARNITVVRGGLQTHPRPSGPAHEKARNGWIFELRRPSVQGNL